MWCKVNVKYFANDRQFTCLFNILLGVGVQQVGCTHSSKVCAESLTFNSMGLLRFISAFTSHVIENTAIVCMQYARPGEQLSSPTSAAQPRGRLSRCHLQLLRREEGVSTPIRCSLCSSHGTTTHVNCFKHQPFVNSATCADMSTKHYTVVNQVLLMKLIILCLSAVCVVVVVVMPWRTRWMSCCCSAMENQVNELLL